MRLVYRKKGTEALPKDQVFESNMSNYIADTLTSTSQTDVLDSNIAKIFPPEAGSSFPTSPASSTLTERTKQATIQARYE
jgi:hypothetical protein